MGHRVAVAPSLLFTMMVEDLEDCLGVLPPDYLTGIMKYFQGEECFPRGLPYLDEHDIRFIWHEDLLESLQPLMAKVWKAIEG